MFFLSEDEELDDELEELWLGMIGGATAWRTLASDGAASDGCLSLASELALASSSTFRIF